MNSWPGAVLAGELAEDFVTVPSAHHFTALVATAVFIEHADAMLRGPL